MQPNRANRVLAPPGAVIETQIGKPVHRTGRGFLLTVVLALLVVGAGIVAMGARLMGRRSRASGGDTAAQKLETTPLRRLAREVPYRRFAPRPVEIPVEPAASAAPQLTGPQVREQLLREIRESGVAGAPWTRNAVSALTSTLAGLPPELAARARPGAVSCYTIGCMVDVVYTDEYAARDLDEVMLNPESEVSRWPGTKHRSPLAPNGSGGFLGTWVLFAKTEPQTQQEQR
jgi:hypothetical protein